jgi:hypothetical protein
MACSVLGLIDPEDEGNMILQNVRNHSPESIMSHPRRLESSKSSCKYTDPSQNNF